MKFFSKILVAMTLLLLMPKSTSACGWDGYQASLDDPFQLVTALSADDGYEKAVDAGVKESIDFWMGYTNGSISRDDMEASVKWMRLSQITDDTDDSNKLINYLRKNNDREALSFLRLNSTVHRYRDWRNNWEMDAAPLESEWNELYRDICQLSQKGRLADRVIFLKMRCLYGMDRYDECEQLWNTQGKKVGNAALRNRMYGYVGGIYYHRKKYEEALKVFYELGDNRSVHSCVDALMTSGGMKRLYDYNPNDITLKYVAQDYANYYYHCMCCRREAMENEYEFTVEKDGIWEHVLADYNQVLGFAKSMSTDSKVKDKAFWQGFVGFMLWTEGSNPEEAYDWLSKSMQGLTDKNAIDQVRAIRFLAAMNAMQKGKKKSDFDDFFIQETRYFVERCKYGNAGSLAFLFADEYRRNAVKCYEYSDFAVMLIKMVCNVSDHYSYDWTEDYTVRSNEYDDGTEKNVDDLIAMRRIYDKGGDSKVEHGLIDIVDKEAFGADKFNDFIGTLMLREMRFAEAAEYLAKVPLSYMNQQGIAPYLALRKMPKTPFMRQTYESLDDSDARMAYNVKLDYAKSMAQLKESMEKSTGEAKAQAAYELAHNVFQSSWLGDRWALTLYSRSSWMEWDPCFANIGNLLQAALNNTNNPNLKKKIYYGLLAVPGNNQSITWNGDGWSFDDAAQWQIQGLNGLMGLVLKSDYEYTSCDIVRSYYAQHHTSSSPKKSFPTGRIR